MSQLANQSLQVFQLHQFLTQDAVCLLDVSICLNRWELYGLLDAIKRESNHVLRAYKIPVALVKFFL